MNVVYDEIANTLTIFFVDGVKIEDSKRNLKAVFSDTGSSFVFHFDKEDRAMAAVVQDARRFVRLESLKSTDEVKVTRIVYLKEAAEALAPSSPPDEARHAFLYEDFKKRLLMLGEPQFSTKFWKSRCDQMLQHLRTKPVKEFLSWSDVVDMYEVPLFHPWYHSLRASALWSSRWKPLSRKSPFGHAHEFSSDEGTAPVPLQHAYHLKMFEEATETRFIEGVDAIVEVGGGYGNFSRMLRRDGFKGPHFIVDLPHTREFQRLFLSLNDVPVSEKVDGEDGVHLLTEESIERLLQFVDSKNKRVAFLATWSLSETPLAFRDRFFPRLHRSVERYLLASQWYDWPPKHVETAEEDRIDNVVYFDKFMKDAQVPGGGDVLWKVIPVPYYETEQYLFGARTRSHAASFR